MSEGLALFCIYNLLPYYLKEPKRIGHLSLSHASPPPGSTPQFCRRCRPQEESQIPTI